MFACHREIANSDYIHSNQGIGTAEILLRDTVSAKKDSIGKLEINEINLAIVSRVRVANLGHPNGF